MKDSLEIFIRDGDNLYKIPEELLLEHANGTITIKNKQGKQ